MWVSRGEDWSEVFLIVKIDLDLANSICFNYGLLKFLYGDMVSENQLISLKKLNLPDA